MLDYLTLFLAAAAAGLAALGLHKARRIHLKQFDLDRLMQERVDNLYTQLTTLNRLEHALSLPGALPSTRGWASSPDFLWPVHELARTHRPGTVVECSSGTSTIVLARTLQMNGAGHVYSLEHEPLYAGKTRGALQELGLQTLATVIDAPLVPHAIDGRQHRWYQFDALPGNIDMLVIDGPPVSTQPMARYPALPLLIERLAPGGIVVLDDATRPDESAAVAQWIQRFGLVRIEGYFAEKGIAVLQRPARQP